MLNLIKEFLCFLNSFLLSELCFFESLFFQCLTLVRQPILMSSSGHQCLVESKIYGAQFVNKGTIL